MSLLPWSYSKLSTYEKCPRQAKYRYVDKLPEPKSRHLERGNEAHARMETWMRAGAKPDAAPDEARKFIGYVSERLPDAIIVEEMWGHAKDWSPTTGKPWMRVKMDVVFPSSSVIVDWKTGKKYDSHRDQGLVYAVTYLMRYNDPKVLVEFAYLDLGEVADMEVRRAEIPAVIKDFGKRVTTMLADKTFKPKPSRLCDWCAFSKTKGGPCEAA